MLTYLDMTVLTYEIEMGVEREDVKGAESSRTAGMGATARPRVEGGGGSAGAGGLQGEGIDDQHMLDAS